MSDTTSEAALISACQRGEREAFRQLFERYQHRVWTIALHYTGDETAAFDMSQQVFLKLFKALPQFRHESRFVTWLYRLVANECLDEKRKTRRWLSFDFWHKGEEETGGEPEGPSDLAEWQATAMAAHELDYERGELTATIKLAVNELSPPIRLTILLKYFEDMSYEEIALTLDCSMGTVASRMNRGHKALAIKLAHLRKGES